MCLFVERVQLDDDDEGEGEVEREKRSFVTKLPSLRGKEDLSFNESGTNKIRKKCLQIKRIRKSFKSLSLLLSMTFGFQKHSNQAFKKAKNVQVTLCCPPPPR